MSTIRIVRGGALKPGSSPELRVGFLYPGYAAEDDLPRLASMFSEPVVAEVVHTSIGEDAHRVEALLDMGDAGRLAQGAAQFSRDAASVVWTCTSGSFVYGWDGARQQIDMLQQAAGRPASSTSLAFVHAARAIGLERVAVAATYPEDVAERFRQFLGDAGLQVVGMTSHGIMTAAQVGTLPPEAMSEMVLAADQPGADAVLVPDTAMHSVASISAAERATGKPVLTANQVSMWEALRLAGRTGLRADAGRLFAATAPVM